MQSPLSSHLVSSVAACSCVLSCFDAPSSSCLTITVHHSPLATRSQWTSVLHLCVHRLFFSFSVRITWKRRRNWSGALYFCRSNCHSPVEFLNLSSCLFHFHTPFVAVRSLCSTLLCLGCILQTVEREGEGEKKKIKFTSSASPSPDSFESLVRLAFQFSLHRWVFPFSLRVSLFPDPASFFSFLSFCIFLLTLHPHPLHATSLLLPLKDSFHRVSLPHLSIWFLSFGSIGSTFASMWHWVLWFKSRGQFTDLPLFLSPSYLSFFPTTCPEWRLVTAALTFFLPSYRRVFLLLLSGVSFLLISFFLPFFLLFHPYCVQSGDQKEKEGKRKRERTKQLK